MSCVGSFTGKQADTQHFAIWGGVARWFQAGPSPENTGSFSLRGSIRSECCAGTAETAYLEEPDASQQLFVPSQVRLPLATRRKNRGEEPREVIGNGIHGNHGWRNTGDVPFSDFWIVHLGSTLLDSTLHHSSYLK